MLEKNIGPVRTAQFVVVAHFVAESDYLSIMNAMVTCFSTEEILDSFHLILSNIIDNFRVCFVSHSIFVNLNIISKLK